MSHTAMRVLEQRRKLENQYRDMDAVISSNRKQLQIANFEIATSAKIERKIERDEAVKSKMLNDELLKARRQRLAKIYNEEMEMWKAEALSSVESIEDRKKRVMQRAYALKEAREKQKAAYIEQCYNKQWRDACDDARALDSEATAAYMHEQRVAQIEEKIRLKEQLTKEENDCITSWRQQLMEAEVQERRLEAERAAANLKTKNFIAHQISEKSKQREDFFNFRRQEEERELTDIRAQMRQDEEKVGRRKQQELQRGQELAESNQQHLLQLERQQAQQRRQDELLLNYAIQQERQRIEAEEAKKRANRDAGTQYKEYLQEQMMREAEDTAITNEINRQAEEKLWNEREAALKAREDARRTLQESVEEGRREQIRLKAEQMLREKYQGMEFANKYIQSAREGLEKERQEIEERRQQNVRNKQELLEHMEIQRAKRELERQQEYLQTKEMEYMERVHQEKLKLQAGKARLNFPLKSSVN